MSRNNRAFRFRVWSFFDKDFIHFDIDEYPSGIYGGLSNPHQYIGITDISGREIFEWDIVKLHYKDGLSEGNWVVKYFEPTAQFVLDKQLGKREYLQDHDVYDLASKIYKGRFEIVGNIFESIEKLK